jgi:hypothetical protein
MKCGVQCAPGHPDRVVYLESLASALLNGFEQTGQIQDLVEATSHLRDAPPCILLGITIALCHSPISQMP